MFVFSNSIARIKSVTLPKISVVGFIRKYKLPTNCCFRHSKTFKNYVLDWEGHNKKQIVCLNSLPKIYTAF